MHLFDWGWDFHGTNPGEDIRDGLKKAMDAATKVNNDVADKLNVEAREQVKATSGVTIHQLKPEQRAQWKKAMESVWDKFSSEIGKDLIAAAQKANSGATN